MSASVEVDGSPFGHLLAFDGAILTLRGDAARAPGAPVRLAVTADGERVTVDGRSLGSKRASDARFVLRVRLVNLRRADREWLRRIAGGTSRDSSGS